MSPERTLIAKRPLGKYRRRWEDNIRMDLKEIVINTRNWVDSAQDRYCECDIEPPGFIKHGVSHPRQKFETESRKIT